MCDDDRPRCVGVMVYLAVVAALFVAAVIRECGWTRESLKIVGAFSPVVFCFALALLCLVGIAGAFGRQDAIAYNKGIRFWTPEDSDSRESWLGRWNRWRRNRQRDQIFRKSTVRKRGV